ncbi:MAG: hypothetical protein H0W73_19810 [Bacteroidetes bacterium]|nr:hypothetical protein [Bacteroidota bacterium]
MASKEKILADIEKLKETEKKLLLTQVFLMYRNAYRLDLIKATVCAELKVDPELIHTPTRKQEVALARHLIMYLVYNEGIISLVETGRLYGGRGHASVIHGRDRIKLRIKKDADFNALVTKIIKRINQE